MSRALNRLRSEGFIDRTMLVGADRSRTHAWYLTPEGSVGFPAGLGAEDLSAGVGVDSEDRLAGRTPAGHVVVGLDGVGGVVRRHERSPRLGRRRPGSGGRANGRRGRRRLQNVTDHRF